ncbi:phosphoadenosine phosphosulfate reductase domain-containing protein [Streptomyces rochei]|uniref:phosphoadenosine phosphosulfate reductase domain-containing protein n=1 Tax=Streptomyces rochei TaxID=1928 RepID=UPI003631AD9B
MPTDALFSLRGLEHPQEAPAAVLIVPQPKPKSKRKRRRAVHPSVPFTPSTTVPDELIRDADWVVISSSGGKDSQAMLWYVVRRAKALGMLDKVVVVHADLGRAEWEGTRELAELQARLCGVRRFEVVTSGIDFLDRVETRHRKLKAKAETEALERGEDPAQAKVAPAWPSSSARWCTSGEKRGPIRTLYTRLTDELAHLGRPVRILACIGQRAAESTQRARLAEVEIDRGGSNGKRHITTWRPIHTWNDQRVWREIARSRLPYHPAYDWGNRRHVDRTTGRDTRVSSTVRRAASVGSHATRMEGCAWHYRTMWSAMSKRSGCHGGAEWLRRAASCRTRYRTPTASRSNRCAGTCVTSSPKAVVSEASGATPTTCCGGGGGCGSSTSSGTR